MRPPFKNDYNADGKQKRKEARERVLSWLHIVACCSTCPHCDKHIAGSMRNHIEDVHRAD